MQAVPVAVVAVIACASIVVGVAQRDAQAGRRRVLVPAGLRGAAAVRTTGPRTSRAPGATASGAVGGRVQFVTEKRAYLDRGARDGLSLKQSVQILRAGRPVAACTVETLADHQSTCVGARLRAGDTFRLSTRSDVAKSAPVPQLAPPIPADTLRARAVEISETPVEKVDFSGVRAFGGRARATLTPSITIWRTQSDPAGAYTEERIDGAVQVFDVGAPGIRLDAAFSAVRWSAATGIQRFRPNQQAQFYVWEAELSRRQRDAHTVFAVGRIWPWHTPGLTMLDGIQVGRHNEADTAEGGFYAGLLPATLTVNPSRAWATGIYGSLVQIGSNKRVFRLARQEARVGIWNPRGTGMVAEVEALAQVWLGAWNLGTGGRLRRASGLGTGPGSGTGIDRAYVDLGARATAAFGGGLHVRYFGAASTDEAVLRAEVPTLRGSLHATVDAHWTPVPWLGFAGFAGLHQERESNRRQTYEALEVRLPRLFRDSGGISAGAEVEEGWMRGRLLYGQLHGGLGERLHLVLRTSASATAFTVDGTSGNIHELGAYTHLDGVVSSWLRLRVWSLLRLPFAVQGEPPATPTAGAIVGCSLTGVF